MPRLLFAFLFKRRVVARVRRWRMRFACVHWIAQPSPGAVWDAVFRSRSLSFRLTWIFTSLPCVRYVLLITLYVRRRFKLHVERLRTARVETFSFRRHTDFFSAESWCRALWSVFFLTMAPHWSVGRNQRRCCTYSLGSNISGGNSSFCSFYFPTHYHLSADHLRFASRTWLEDSRFYRPVLSARKQKVLRLMRCTKRVLVGIPPFFFFTYWNYWTSYQH